MIEQLVAALGHEPGLEALRGAEHEHLVVGVALAQAVGDGEQRVHVAGGPAAGQQVRRSSRGSSRRSCRGAGVGARGRRWSAASGSRANDSTTPIATSTVSRAVPPADMRGSGTPSTGKHAEHDADVDERLADDPHHDRRRDAIFANGSRAGG